MLVAPAQAGGPWLDNDRPHRFDVELDPAGVDRNDLDVVVSVDFSVVLVASGFSGATFDDTSIRVVEVNTSGAVVPGGSSVPFQFDPSSTYDATTSAAGELTILMTGATTSSRLYQVYFRDTASAGSFTPVDHSGLGRVSALTGQVDESRAVTTISNIVGTWFYDNEGGGFTSVVDGSNRDWIGWNATPGSGGMFRGLPNLEFPTNEFHPGFDQVSTTVDAVGPLRVVLTSTSDDGMWKMRLSFFKRNVVIEVLETPTAEEYWFQYEGTPGGSLGPEDVVIRNDGTVTGNDQAWATDLTDLEWVAVGDTALNRSFYIAQLTPDSATDSYSALDGVMTVLAFGRAATGLNQELLGPRTFVVGLVAGSDPGAISSLINSDIVEVTASITDRESVQTMTTSSTTTAPGSTTVAPSSTTQPLVPTNSGYLVVASTGRVFTYGDQLSYGNAPAGVTDVVAAALTPSGNGYWMVRATGEVLAFGDAAHQGDITSLALQLASPIVGMAATPAGDGYWLLGSDGGIFSFGNADFFGSTGGIPLNAPVIDMAATASGGGYYLVALDGGIFTYGDAVFLGSTGNLVLDRPVVSLTLGTDGYWLVALDGGIFAFGEDFLGSIPSALSQLAPDDRPEGRRIRATSSGDGYVVATADGGVFAFGDAVYFGAPSADFVGGEIAVDLLMGP